MSGPVALYGRLGVIVVTRLCLLAGFGGHWLAGRVSGVLTPFGGVDVFLRINGIRLVAKPMAIHKWMIGHLEKGTFALASIETYLRKYTRKA